MPPLPAPLSVSLLASACDIRPTARVSPLFRTCLIAVALVAVGALAKPTSVQVRLDGERVVTSRRVMFKSGLMQFTPEGAVVVDAIAAFLAKQPDRLIVIEGYTDGGGNEVENIRLSQGRADELRRALVRRGLDPLHVQALGRGSSVPLVAASHPEQYRNRRVEIFVRSLDRAVEPEEIPPTIALLDDDPAPVVAATSPAPTFALLGDDLAPGVEAGSVGGPSIALMDDEPLTTPPGFTIPLLDELMGSDADEDDELLVPQFAAMTTGTPSIPLLDEIGRLE